MHEKFCVRIKVLYALEMFKCLRVFPLLQRKISRGYPVNRVVPSVRKLSPYITGRSTTDLGQAPIKNFPVQ